MQDFYGNIFTPIALLLLEMLKAIGLTAYKPSHDELSTFSDFHELD